MPVPAKIERYVFNFNAWKFFLLLTGFTALTAFAFNFLFISEGLYYQSFGEQMAADRIAKMIELSQKWQWVGYVLIPVIVVVRVCFPAICLYVGCFITGLNINFGKLFKVALLADFVFVFAGIAKLATLIFFKNVTTLSDLQFHPLSLLEALGRSSVEPYFIYSLSLINLFELIYWLVLAWLLTEAIGKSFGQSLKTVTSSYGTGLLLWVLFIMFLTINLT